MRKEIPLIITALVGVVLILQFFSPYKTINSIEKLFTDWFQIVAAFSMILGVLNLIRVSGDKIYKKRKNWQFSVIIVVSLFSMMIIGFANVGENYMYDRKVLKTNTPVINNLAKSLMEEEGITNSDPNYDAYLLALVEGIQKEKTISSILPHNLGDPELKKKYVKILDKLKVRSKKIVENVNEIGRELNVEIKSTLKRMESQKFADSFLIIYDSIYEDFNTISSSMNIKNAPTIEKTIKEQLKAVILKSLTKNFNFKKSYLTDQYLKITTFIKMLNEFLLNQEGLYQELKVDIKKSVNFDDFLKISTAKISLKLTDPFNKLLLDKMLPIYMNHIYRFGVNINSQKYQNLLNKEITSFISKNDYVLSSITSYLEKELQNRTIKDIKKYINSYNSYIDGNKILTSTIIIDLVSADIIPHIFKSKKEEIISVVKNTVKSPLEFRKLKTEPKVISDVAVNNAKVVMDEGFDKNRSILVIKILLNSGKYKLDTLENGSSFMEMYRYVFSPLSSTMFALLAFFIASASYRAFRARNKEATLLLVAGFLVMLGRIPVGDSLMKFLHLDGFISISDISQFIMDVPNMAGQRAIMIGIALGVISTSLRLILGIERSHLGGE